MPSIPPLTAVATSTFTCVGSTHNQMITCGLTNPGGAAPAILTAQWRAAIHAAGRPLAANSMSQDYTLTETKVICNIGGSLYVDVNSVAVVGTLLTQSIPPNAAFLVRKDTGIAGRKYRGRMFTPPAATAEGNVSAAGIIGATQLTALQALWTAAFNDLTSSGYRPCLIHLVPQTWTLLTAFTVNAKVGTLKRRLRG